MKIFIDIGHPAHVHYFKNFIRIMKDKGHEFYITARERKHVFALLENNELDFHDRGKGSSGVVGKIIYLLKTVFKLYFIAKKVKPDIFLDMGTVYASPVAKLMKKPYIAFEDTEIAGMYRALFMPFTSTICTVSCFNKDLGKKQISFKGYMELCYLHPNYFTPDPGVLDLLKVEKNEKYIIIRFVSWEAVHDIGHSGFNLENRIRVVEEVSKHAKVFITSEGELPPELEQYHINIPPESIHDAMAYADLYIGEGATMASECAMLGTPAIYVNSLSAGTLEEQEKYGLLYGFRNFDGVLKKATELIRRTDLKEECQKRRKKMLSEKIDVTAFIVWFIDNYPESVHIMKTKPEYQERFK